jgi:alpha-ribazole phosphatase
MMLIDLLRHGETQMPGRLLGRTDPPLSEAGWRQMERQTAGRSWDVVVASPRRRAEAGAARVAAERGRTLRIDADWAELDFGGWDGRLLADVRADPEAAEAFAAFYASPDAAAPPGGESWSALVARVARALDRVLAEPAASTALVVTHAGPMRATLALTCAIPFANLRAFSIKPGTRLTLRAGRDNTAGLWGEIVEVVQP